MSDETMGDDKMIIDWNFIVTDNGNRIYDLRTGILYRLVYHEDEPGIYIQSLIHSPGSSSWWYTGDEALSFWKQLTARIEWEEVIE